MKKRGWNEFSSRKRFSLFLHSMLASLRCLSRFLRFVQPLSEALATPLCVRAGRNTLNRINPGSRVQRSSNSLPGYALRSHSNHKVHSQHSHLDFLPCGSRELARSPRGYEITDPCNFPKVRERLKYIYSKQQLSLVYCTHAFSRLLFSDNHLCFTLIHLDSC